MKVTIDDSKFQQYDAVQAMLLFAMHDITPTKIKELQEKKLLFIDDDGMHVDDSTYQDLLAKIKVADNGMAVTGVRLTNLAKKMRELYPEGKQVGGKYYYRGNDHDIALKLNKFFTIYGDKPDEDILDAEKKFVASFNGDYKYLPLLKYFIYKEKTVWGEDEENHKAPESVLATVLENKDDKDIVTASSDWLYNVRV